MPICHVSSVIKYNYTLTSLNREYFGAEIIYFFFTYSPQDKSFNPQ